MKFMTLKKARIKKRADKFLNFSPCALYTSQSSFLWIVETHLIKLKQKRNLPNGNWVVHRINTIPKNQALEETRGRQHKGIVCITYQPILLPLNTDAPMDFGLSAAVRTLQQPLCFHAGPYKFEVGASDWLFLSHVPDSRCRGIRKGNICHLINIFFVSSSVQITEAVSKDYLVGWFVELNERWP